MSYHEDQLAANRVLAEKVGMPGEVMVQDFLPELHSNLLNEVELLGEIDLGKRTRVEIPHTPAHKTVDVIPVYAVSREGYPLVTQRMHRLSGDPRRPMPRSRAFEVRRDYAVLKGLERLPLAVLVLEDGTQKIAEMLRNGALGDGRHGPLVPVAGTIIAGGPMIDATVDGMTEAGFGIGPETLFVSPYVEGREAVMRVPDYGWLKAALVWTGIAMFLGAAIAILPVYALIRRNPPAAPVAPVAAVGDFPAVGFFQPIRTQEELAVEESPEGPRARRAARVLSRVVARAG